MKAMWLTKSSLIWYAVTLGSLALVIGSLIALIRSILARRSRRILLAAGLNLLAGFLLSLVLMDCARFAYLTEPDPRYRPFQTALFGLPWGLYAIPEILSAAILLLLLRDDADEEVSGNACIELYIAVFDRYDGDLHTVYTAGVGTRTVFESEGRKHGGPYKWNLPRGRAYDALDKLLRDEPEFMGDNAEEGEQYRYDYLGMY